VPSFFNSNATVYGDEKPSAVRFTPSKVAVPENPPPAQVMVPAVSLHSPAPLHLRDFKDKKGSFSPFLQPSKSIVVSKSKIVVKRIVVFMLGFYIFMFWGMTGKDTLLLQ